MSGAGASSRPSWLGTGVVLLALVLTSACGGLIEGATDEGSTDSSTDSSTGTSTGAASSVGSGQQGIGDSGSGDCPPTQWDCSGTPISCDYVTNAFGETRPVVSLGAPCRCDVSRPAVPTDCPENQLFVCGSLGWEPEQTLDGVRSFDAVSCRCAPNAGYYCGHCVTTGLYQSVEDAAGCGLEGDLEGGRTAVFCGCGEER